MRVVTCLFLCLWSAIALADITATDLAAWKKLDYHSFDKDKDEEGQVAARLMKTPGVGLDAAAQALAAEWHVSVPAARAAFEIVISIDAWSWDHDPKPLPRIESSFKRALAAAPDSRQIWEMWLRWMSRREVCDVASRDSYFQKTFATRFLELDVCHDWYPEYARLHPRDVAVLDALRRYIRPYSPADALAVNEAELEVDAAPRDRAPSPLTLYLLRSKLATLHSEDLGGRVLEFVANLPPAWRADMFGLEIKEDVTIGDIVLATSAYGAPSVEDARVAWIVSLLDAGRDDEARAAIESFHMPRGTAPHEARTGRESQVFDADGADSAEFLRDLTAAQLDGDLFDRYAGNGIQGLLWGPASDGLAARRLAARMLRAHGLPSPAAYLDSVPCSYFEPRDNEPRPEAGWRDRMTPAFRDAASRWAAELVAVRARTACVDDARHTEPRSAGLPRYREVPLSAAEKQAPPQPNYKPAIPLPEGFELVRAEKRGARIAALCQSSAVDPAGEITGGGYWLLLSLDGRTFGEPYYLGFQAMHPYVLTQKARVPLLVGDTLHVEVKIRELDPASITFPPVGLKARRSVDDLYIEIPLQALELDSDHDGLPDVLERRIGTNPDMSDTDGDGAWDGADDLPLVASGGAPNPLAGLVAEVLKQIAGFDAAAIIEPLREPGTKQDSLDAMLAGTRRGSSTRAFTFIEGDRALFTGVRLGPNQTALVLDAAQVRDLNARYGPTLPLEFPMLVVDEKRERAVVTWSAGWTGGTLRFTLKDGKWLKEEISSWIS